MLTLTSSRWSAAPHVETEIRRVTVNIFFNGQTRYTGNMRNTRHRTRTNKKKNN
jgi:hypothetical protein